MLLNESGLENFNKWLTALRDSNNLQIVGALSKNFRPDYGQEIGALKRGYCCLGICADTLGCDWKQTGQSGFLIKEKNGLYQSYLPKEFLDAVGIPDCMQFDRETGYDVVVNVPLDIDYIEFDAEELKTDEFCSGDDFEFKGLNCRKMLASILNDSRMVNFKQIADLLEFTYL